jgi:integrase
VIQQGQVFKLKARSAGGEPLWAYRFRVAGRGSARLQVAGSRAGLRRRGRFRTSSLGWCPAAVRRRSRSASGSRSTWRRIRVNASRSRSSAGCSERRPLSWAGVRLVELSPEHVCAWRLTVPEGHRFEATQALRQVLNRAVAWKLIDENPAKRGVPNPGRRCREQRPFDSWAQIGSVARRLGPTFAPMVVFAAATGLRPSELFALEHGDVDVAAGVVHVRRAYANGRVKHPKTRLSRRAVPLQAIALEALDQLRARKDGPLLFSNARGGHLDFRNFNRRHWKPVQRAVGIEPLRDLYDLRHTYATFALRAGVPVFALSRFMGTSIAMIDLHYGHLAIDSYQHAVSLLDALALERAVDAGWTPAPNPGSPRGDTVSRPCERASRRAVDARWTSTPRQLLTGASGNG